MVDLLPGAALENARALVDSALRGAENVRGAGHRGFDLLNAYREWATQQARILASVLAPASVDSLVLSTGYGRLLQLDPAAWGNQLGGVVELELVTVVAALTEANAALERQQQHWTDWRYTWGGRAVPAIVLDTNVLLRHADRLAQLNWYEPLQVDADASVALGVPLIAVKELDDLKTSNNKMEVDGQDVTVRSRVRIVHKLLDQWFAGSSRAASLLQRSAVHPGLGELRVQLMVDDLRHVRLPTADAEIIDRALALTPFTAGVGLATNDRAMRIQARFEGLNAFDPQLLPSL